MRNVDPEKVAERKRDLCERLAGIQSALKQPNQGMIDRAKLEIRRDLILHELEAMELKPCPPSELDNLRAEVERLEGEVTALNKANELKSRWLLEAETEVERLTDGLRTIERRSYVPGRDIAEHLRQVARSFLDGNNTGAHALELEAENDRLKAEVERLRNAVQLGLHPNYKEAK